MISRHLLATFALLTTIAASAQDVADGFYRVQNYGSKRYAYVYDNTGKIDISNTTADMGAITLYRDSERRLTDPASVIYVSYKGKNGNYNLYDLEAQGTGVYKIINYYISVVKLPSPNQYWVFEPTYNMYLWDGITSTYYDKSSVTTQSTNKPENRNWSIFPINSTTDEYLGISPASNLQLAGKYYKPYYIGFAFDMASTGMKAYYVADVKPDAVIIKEITGTVPAATPVIVECSTNAAATNRVNLYKTTVAKITDNKLSGNYFCYGSHGPTAFMDYDASTMRLLAVKDGHLCYVTDTNHQHTTALPINGVTKYCVPANESYLTVPAGTAAELPVMTEAEYEALHPTTKRGDVNGDGRINATDAALLYRHIAAGKKSSEVPAADINGDGNINATDAALLYRIIAAGQ